MKDLTENDNNEIMYNNFSIIELLSGIVFTILIAIIMAIVSKHLM